MRRSTARVLGTALLLLLAVSFPALAEKTSAHRAAETPQTNSTPPHAAEPTTGNGASNQEAADSAATAAQHKLQEDAEKARQGVGQLLQQQSQVLETLQRVESSLWLYILLGLIALLTTGALLLGLLQLRTLRTLQRQVGELGERLEILSFGSAATSAGINALEVGVKTGILEENAELPQAGARQLSARPAAKTTPSPKGDASRPELRPGETAPRTPPQPHQKIADLLAGLHEEAPKLAESFSDLSLRERFRGEFDAPLSARLDRLRTCSDEAQLKERWLGPDLVTTLDALARFYSEAVEEGRHGRAAAKGLARDLRHWLYDNFSPACRSEGWFAIDPVDPYKTEFDPNVHHAVAGRDVDGAEGKIIAIKTIGRRDPRSGAVIHKAEVIVGR